MKIKVFHNIHSVRKEFKNLENNSHPLQKYSVVKNIFSFPYFIEPLFYNLKKFRTYNFFVIYDDNKKPLIILPTTRQKNELFVMGGKEWDYVDLIYNNNDTQLLEEAFIFLINYLKCKGISKINWFYMPEASAFYSILKNLNNKLISTEFNEEKNVNIFFGDNYDNYFSLLKKSVRQNCRTAYNRLSRDNKSFQLKVFFPKDNHKLKDNKIALKTFKKCMKLYLQRQTKKYHTPQRYALRIKYYDYFTKSATNENGFISTLEIDNKIAAFMMGLTDAKNKSIIIPRIAIEDDFSFYSPGLCLINETIHHLTENTLYSNLDLCDGDEKYKFDMGGKEYLTYKLNINIL